MHVAHQLFDVGSVGETGGQFRVRIVLRGRTAHGHQAAILRFFPGPVMHAAPCGRPRHDPAAVHGHGGQAGSLGIGALRVCSACAVACCSRCSRNSCPIMPLRSMISGNADRNLRQLPQHLLGLARRLVFRIGGDNLVQHGGTIAPLVQAQRRTLGKKSPAAGRAIAGRFMEINRPVNGLQFPLPMHNRAPTATGWTGLRLRETLRPS